MLNPIKLPIVSLIFIFLVFIGPAMSYAWGGHGGGYHSGGGYHGYVGRGFHGWGKWGGYYGYGNFGLGYSYWPYNYYYAPAYYDAGVLVSPPIAAAAPVPADIAPASIDTPGIEDAITINIPNLKGGYTSVSLKRSGQGFIGPQGEYYPEFPRVSQLKLMYG